MIQGAETVIYSPFSLEIDDVPQTNIVEGGEGKSSYTIQRLEKGTQSTRTSNQDAFSATSRCGQITLRGQYKKSI